MNWKVLYKDTNKTTRLLYFREAYSLAKVWGGTLYWKGFKVMQVKSIRDINKKAI